MKEFVIDACKWYVNSDMDDASKIEAIENFKSRYTPLLGFLLESKLYRNKLPNSLEDWQIFEIKISDFSEEGLELVMQCHDQWLDSVNRGIKPGNINLWKRELSKLRRESNDSLH